MANSEKSFQTELLQQMRQAGYHAFKVTTPFMTGVPDLFVKAPGMPACWIELKYEVWDMAGVKRGYIPLNLSALQRKFIWDEQKVGGHAGWAVCMRNSSAWDLFAGTDAQRERIEIPSLQYIGSRAAGQSWPSLQYIGSRAAGQSWDVQKLVEIITNG